MSFIYFVFVLGVVVCVHEFGHFLFAKKAGIYVYEFSIGMGPRLFQWHRKGDETTYSIRLFPIGGYVRMAGEEVELDKDIPEEKRMQAKTWWQKFWTIIAGVLFNFILAFVIFVIVAWIAGTPQTKPVIHETLKDSPAYGTYLQKGDQILKIDSTKIYSLDHFLVEFQVRNGKEMKLLVEHENGTKESIKIKPEKKVVDDVETYQYGFSLDNSSKRNFWTAISYGFTKIISLFHQMILIIFYLCTGAIGIDSLAGPIGIFNVVSESAKAGFINVIYLIGFLSVNVGFINLLPIPAFDGGRLLFLVIEKITKKPLKPETENMIHAVGFILLMLLMIVITWNDITRLFR